jgi:hypothetical protein
MNTLHSRALASTALLALFVFTAQPAAACTLSALTLTCSGVGDAPVSNSDDNLVATVEVGASVISNDRDTAAFALGGADQTLTNDGTVQNTSTANNTNAIALTGAGTTIENNGIIDSGDRAIHAIGGGGGLTVNNNASGVITSRRQTIRTENALNLPNVTVNNEGLIESQDGRAIQARGTGLTVINSGTITGGEEVIEGRMGVRIENTGTIRLRDGVEDEDGVQFAEGTVINSGLIQGSDDGIDVDEGLIRNLAGGRIISAPAATDTARAGNGIDADEITQDPVNGDRTVGVLRIVNEGLIEGPRAIGSAVDRPAAINIENSGTLRGVDTAAVDLFVGMDGSSLLLTGNSQIFGSVLMTDNDDAVSLGDLTTSLLMANISADMEAVFDGRGGNDTATLDYGLGDLLRFDVAGDRVDLVLAAVNGPLSGSFLSFETWVVGGRTFAAADLAATIAPVPLPAGLPLMAVALGGLVVLRRRRRA